MALHLSIGPLKTRWVGAGTEMRTQYLTSPLSDDSATVPSRPVKKKKRFWATKEMLYLTTHSTHFIYGYMASDIW